MKLTPIYVIFYLCRWDSLEPLPNCPAGKKENRPGKSSLIIAARV